jgi:hypothetical protein
MLEIRKMNHLSNIFSGILLASEEQDEFWNKIGRFDVWYWAGKFWGVSHLMEIRI